jgi:hypothetical protein
MKADWKEHASAPDFSVSRSAIQVAFPSQRNHRVEVDGEDEETWRFRAVVAKPGALDQLPEDDGMLPWQLNRATTLVGYRYDQHGRLVGEAWVPRTATSEEFQFVVRHLATECDRMELRITGADEH